MKETQLAFFSFLPHIVSLCIPLPSPASGWREVCRRRRDVKRGCALSRTVLLCTRLLQPQAKEDSSGGSQSIATTFLKQEPKGRMLWNLRRKRGLWAAMDSTRVAVNTFLSLKGSLLRSYRKKLGATTDGVPVNACWVGYRPLLASWDRLDSELWSWRRVDHGFLPLFMVSFQSDCRLKTLKPRARASHCHKQNMVL